MDYYGNNDWRDYHLSHYGVKGMKKGKHLPGTDWWKEGKLKGGILNVGGGKQIATNSKYKVATDVNKKKKKRKGSGAIFANAGGPGRGEIGGGKNKATTAAAASQTVQRNAVNLDPSAFDAASKPKKARKLGGTILSSKKIKTVDKMFAGMGASAGSLLRDVASGKVQGTSMKKGKTSKSKKSSSRRKR